MSKAIIYRPNGYPHVNAVNEVSEAFDQALATHESGVFFGAHLYAIDSTVCPRRGAIYQTEQITPECRWLTQRYIDVLKTCAVWDYSLSNIEALKSYSVEAKHVPIRYMPCMTKFESLPEEQKDIDVLFYGSTNPRRLKILNDLIKAGVKVEKIFGVYGHERDHVIARSKIVLNLHYFENGIFEIFRCAHLFANKKCVISEYGRDKDLDAAHLKSAVFHKTENIVEACLYYLKNQNARLDQEWMALESFKTPTLEESLK